MHAIGMFDGDAIMICSSAITSLENTTKNIYLSGTLLDEFTSTYYNDKNNSFGNFQNIYIVLLTAFITHKLLKNGTLTCTSQITKIIKIWVFIYLLKGSNYL